MAGVFSSAAYLSITLIAYRSTRYTESLFCESKLLI